MSTSFSPSASGAAELPSSSSEPMPPGGVSGAVGGEFSEFPKMARWSRDVVITEKIDGTNAQVFIADDGVTMLFGSRSRWITPADDNYGFARWCEANRAELLKLGPGRHFGEWWGAGIQRKYNIGEKRFSLFNTFRWSDDAVRPACCHVVPVLYQGMMRADAMDECIAELVHAGSHAAPGFGDPEGVVMFHTAANAGFKKTIKKDEVPKTLADRTERDSIPAEALDQVKKEEV